MPLQVHRRQGEPCPRCGTTLEAVHYEDYVMSYCPTDQTEGRVLKDRRLSRLLKDMIEPGDKAPNFKLPDQDGKTVTLAGLRPARTSSSTSTRRPTPPGCTTQACGVRDHPPDYDGGRRGRARGLARPGQQDRAPSTTSTRSSFPLLADEDHSVAEAYGVWVEKSMYGRKYMGIARATFVIDEKGKVTHVFPKVSPKTHDDEVLAALA